MKKFTIDQAYNDLQWRTVQVQAETLERALEIADDACGYEDYGDDDTLPEGEEGVIACDEWSSGDGGEGPTWTSDIAEGAFDRAYEADIGLAVPDSYCQFVVEWPKEAEELRNAREALHATLPALIRLGDFVGNVDEGGASNQGRIDRCALILQVRAALARTPAPVAKAEGTAVCGVCNRACARESVQFHQGRFVGPCCWDDRLKATQ